MFSFNTHIGICVTLPSKYKGNGIDKGIRETPILLVTLCATVLIRYIRAQLYLITAKHTVQQNY